MAFSLVLSGCLPIPEVVPPRLEPHYLGSEKAEINMQCNLKHEAVWIRNADGLRMRITPLYFPDRQLAVLQFRILAGTHPFIVDTQTPLAMAPLAGGATVLISLPPLPADKELEFQIRIESAPPGGMRISLPILETPVGKWQPGDLELRTRAATIRALPFNC